MKYHIINLIKFILKIQKLRKDLIDDEEIKPYLSSEKALEG